MKIVPLTRPDPKAEHIETLDQFRNFIHNRPITQFVIIYNSDDGHGGFFLSNYHMISLPMIGELEIVKAELVRSTLASSTPHSSEELTPAPPPSGHAPTPDDTSS